MYDIGAEIRALRIQAGLSQQNVADLRHMSLSRVSKIENNKVNLPAQEYLEIKDMLKNVEKVASFTIRDYGMTATLR